MRLRRFHGVLAVSLLLDRLAWRAGAEAKNNSTVLVLDDVSIKDEISKHELMAIKFYTSSCPHCQDLAPVYAEVSEALQDDGIPLAEVNCDDFEDLCSEWGVTSLPTVKISSTASGFVTDYDGALTTEAITSHLRELNSQQYKEKFASVLVVNTQNHKKTINSHQVIMLEFYAPWCPHCQALAPIYADAANLLKEEGIVLGKVDCDVDEDLCDDYVMTSFPTLAIIRDGDVYSHSEWKPRHGEITKESIVEVMRRMSGPVLKTLETVEAVNVFASEEEQDGAVIGLFADESSAERALFKMMAQEIPARRFGVSSDPKVRQEYGADTSDKVVVLKPYDEGRSELTITKETTQDSIVEFVEDYTKPLLVSLSSSEGLELWMSRMKPFVLLLTPKRAGSDVSPTPDGDETGEKALPAMVAATDETGGEGDVEPTGIAGYEVELKAMLSAAAEHRSNFHFMHVSAESEEGKSVEHMVGIAEGEKEGEMVEGEKVEGEETCGDTSKAPLVFLMDGVRDTYDEEDKPFSKYRFESEITSEALVSFGSKFLAGELSPFYLSETPQDTDLEGLVKVVRGNTFDEIVINNENDVLLEIYAPWCGYCQTLEPVYEEVARQLKDIKTLTIAKIDGTKNEIIHPQVKVAGYPTLLLFMGDRKDMAIPHRGKLTENKILDFMRTKVTEQTYVGFPPRVVTDDDDDEEDDGYGVEMGGDDEEEDSDSEDSADDSSDDEEEEDDQENPETSVKEEL